MRCEISSCTNKYRKRFKLFIGEIKMLIEDNFIEERAEEYTRFKNKPFPTFELYLKFCWDIYYSLYIKKVVVDE
jgi:hypothetical protein